MVLGGLRDEGTARGGTASAAHLDATDPFSPINRRISIIVMNKRTEDAVPAFVVHAGRAGPGTPDAATATLNAVKA
jgi:chemotaxis protein MotB